MEGNERLGVVVFEDQSVARFLDEDGMRLVDLADDVELLAIDRNVEEDGEEDAQAVAKGEKTVDEVQQEHHKGSDASKDEE